MARTIEEIKASMVEDFMRNEDIARAYGFEAGDEFSVHFSKVSVESLLFFIVACAIWVLECLFDRHRTDVEDRIEEIMPHRPKWYRDKVLGFMKDMVLVPDCDYYDISGMGDADIEAAKVVRYAAVTESEDSSILTIKVAGENNGERAPLDEETETQLLAYIAEIKDAGVRTSLVNQAPEMFSCEIDVWYDALLLPGNVKADCEAAVKEYVGNLPFNGEYTNMNLINRLQSISGVRVVELRGARATGEDGQVTIDARYVPAAGYFCPGQITINTKAYK